MDNMETFRQLADEFEENARRVGIPLSAAYAYRDVSNALRELDDEQAANPNGVVAGIVNGALAAIAMAQECAEAAFMEGEGRYSRDRFALVSAYCSDVVSFSARAQARMGMALTICRRFDI